MTLQRFLSTILRIKPAEPTETTIRFVSDDKSLAVMSLTFDAEANQWTVLLSKGTP